MNRKIYARDDLASLEGVRMKAAVTPSDTVDLVDPTGAPRPARALLVATAGEVNVLLEDDIASDTLFLAAGVWHPMVVRRVYATSTTATGIRAGW